MEFVDVGDFLCLNLFKDCLKVCIIKSSSNRDAKSEFLCFLTPHAALDFQSKSVDSNFYL